MNFPENFQNSDPKSLFIFEKEKKKLEISKERKKLLIF